MSFFPIVQNEDVYVACKQRNIKKIAIKWTQSDKHEII